MAPANDNYGSEEAQIMADADRMRLIEQCVTDFAIIAVDTEGRIHTWNTGAERIIGYTATEVIGKPVSLILTPEDQQQGLEEQSLQQARLTGHVENERWHVRKDGSQFRGNCVVTALREDDGTLRGYLKILRDLTVHNEAEAQVRALMQQQAILHERTRMAHELHDTLAQGLTGITMQLAIAEDMLEEASPARPYIHRARDIARESLVESRQTVQALRPHALQTADLPSALSQLVVKLTAASGSPIHFEQKGTPMPLFTEVENHLYRIAQEALTNALKYAHATQIDLHLIFTAGRVQLRVHDDGVGFDPQAPPQGGGFGMTSMRERAEQMDGQWHLTTQPGQGTLIEVVLHLT